MRAALRRLRKIPWLAILFRVSAGLVGAFVTYLVVINVLLSTGLAKAGLNRLAPKDVQFDWRTAYSPWIMRVHTTGFVVRGGDSSVDWSVTAERANASLGPLDFFSRRVRLHDAWARGLTTNVRFKTPAAPTPTIDGRLWSIEIDDIIADDVREVQVDTIRVVDADGHAEGGFLFEPRARFYIRPSRIRTENAQVFDGRDPVASGLHGTFELHVSDVDLRDVHRELLEHVDANAAVSSRVGDLRFANRWLHSTGITLAGGGGFTQLAAAVRHGELVPGSRAWLRSEDMSLVSSHDGLSGTSIANATVLQNEPRIVIAVETFGAAVHRDKVEVARSPVISTSVEIDNLDLSKPFDRWTVAIDLPTATVKDLKALDAYLDSPMFYGGAATVKGHANLAPHVVSGHAKVDVSNATMAVNKKIVTASGSAEATLHALDFRSKKGTVDGARLELRNVSGGGEHGWWADLSASKLSIAFAHETVVSGTITGKCGNAEVPLAILGAPPIVRTAFGGQGFTLSTHFRHTGDVTDLSDLRVIGNTIDVHAHFHGADGAAFVESPIVNVGIVVRNGEPSTQLFATRAWYARTQSHGEYGL